MNTVATIGNDLVMSFQPHFIAKTERADALVSRSFRVLSLREFAEDLEEGSLLCPVRTLNIYLRRTSSFVVRASSLFVSPHSPSRPISKSAVSYFLREVISGAGAVPIVFEESQLLFLSCETGRSPRCWRPQLGDRTQCSLFFIFATFLMFFKDCGLLARFSRRAVLLTPRNFIFGRVFNSGD